MSGAEHDRDASTHPSEADGRGRLPTAVRWLLWAIVIAAVVVVLFLWVFPWVESLQQDPTMGLRPPSPAVTTSPTWG